MPLLIRGNNISNSDHTQILERISNGGNLHHYYKKKKNTFKIHHNYQEKEVNRNSHQEE